jgi:hypothetical protein
MVVIPVLAMILGALHVVAVYGAKGSCEHLCQELGIESIESCIERCLQTFGTSGSDNTDVTTASNPGTSGSWLFYFSLVLLVVLGVVAAKAF